MNSEQQRIDELFERVALLERMMGVNAMHVRPAYRTVSEYAEDHKEYCNWEEVSRGQAERLNRQERDAC